MSAFAHMSVAEIRAGLAAGDFSATEIAEASLARAKALDGQLHAFLEYTPELALSTAKAADEAYRGVASAASAASAASGAAPGAALLPGLAGVPMAFKDNMNLRGAHTTCASRMLENYVSP